MTLGTCLLCALGVAAPATLAAQALDLDMTAATRSPRELVVGDRAAVTVAVRRNVFHECVVHTKSEALPTPPHPIAQIIGALGGVAGLGSTRGSPVPRASDPLDAQVELLVAEIAEVSKTLDEQIADVLALAGRLPEAVACGGTPDPCADPVAAAASLRALANRIEATPAAPLASTAQLSSRLAELSKAAVGRSVKNEEVEALPRIFARLRVAQERLDVATARRAALAKARDALLAVRDRVLAFAPSLTVSVPLTPATNTRTVVTASCTNIVTGQPAIYRRAPGAVVEALIAPVSGTVIYRGRTWATVTAGVLASSVDRRTIGVAQVRLKPDTTAAMVDRRVGVTDAGASQLVPFTFFNLVVPGLSGPRGYAAASLGFGLNPNNGPVHPDYFAGGAIGLGRFVAITAGVHVGTRMEPDNGFAEGDVLPSSVTTVPTRRDRKTGFAVALTYGLPLPR
jgi:hypothetical protein